MTGRPESLSDLIDTGSGSALLTPKRGMPGRVSSACCRKPGILVALKAMVGMPEKPGSLVEPQRSGLVMSTARFHCRRGSLEKGFLRLATSEL